MNPKKYDFSFLEKNASSDLQYDLEDLSSKNNVKSILMPPPNITGSLHLGHALNLIIQDFLNRFLILQGEKVRWISGFDHSGIATQAKIESLGIKIGGESAAEKKEFVWKEWYPEQKKKLVSQWESLGLLLDYKQDNFTFNSFSEKEVSRHFSLLYKKGLIYQKERMINWDSKLMTAVSDIEVEQVEKETTLFYVDYKIYGEEKDRVTVATTRPETMFADVALFFNSEDERYLKYRGKFAINPLNGLKLPIVFSKKVKKDFGSGVVKCTPLHDFKDYELALENNLPLVSCYDRKGVYNKLAGLWEGRSFESSFSEIVDHLRKNGSLRSQEVYSKKFAVSQRSGCLIEPTLSLQWFLDLPKMIKEIEKVDPGFILKTNFHPSSFGNKISLWKSEAHEWCISRQLWWGHQIPVWSDGEGNFFTSEEKKKKVDILLKRDENVLDTWFSSGLWPLIVNSDLKFETIDFLVTGSDLIFFWLFKMIVFTNYFSNSPPFKNVFFHGLIRDSSGKKMSKSFNNGIEPDQVISEYGSDALRLYMLSDNSMGSDFFFNSNKIKGFYFFLQKIWSIFSFIVSNFCEEEKFKVLKFKFVEKIVSEDSDDFHKSMNLWLLSELVNVRSNYVKTSKSLETQFSSKILIDFTKEKISGFYIHLLKNQLSKTCLLTLLYVFQQVLVMFNPFIPFLTMHIYRSVSGGSNLIKSILEKDENLTAKKDNLSLIFEFVSTLKNKIFSSLRVSEIKKTHFFLKLNDDFKIEDYVLARVSSILKSRESINLTFGEAEEEKLRVIDLFPYGIIKFKDFLLLEKDDIKKTLEFYNFEIERAKNLLQNKGFLKNSPSQVLHKEKEKLKKFTKQKKQLLSFFEK